ncbi:cell adhesion molecule DSCAM-like isoform X2 [Panonychus citri]|uniref:cell adhesion molecule DSCAM-like isoform X2 n=1 Tax=Panonychus citri TaxID=50023 RepID=UPI00230835E0|nr:cell adhesion molecule DSCAM-like isoform X2 [Panonychus citri]
MLIKLNSNMRCLIVWILLILCLPIKLSSSIDNQRSRSSSSSSSQPFSYHNQWSSSSINNNLKLFRSSNTLDRHGSTFVRSPPPYVDFLNSTGTVIPCSASGLPIPTITWYKDDGSSLIDIPNLRQVSPDGSLVFLPFTASKYRGDVHSTTYKCTASNTLGTIESNPVRVKAVINQHYEIQVYDDFVIRGNTGILRCNVPTFVKDYVTVISWLRSDGNIISSDLFKGGRYFIFPSGELYIQKVDPLTDNNYQYRCQTKHRISGEIKLSSNSGRLIITEPHSNVAPKITDRRIRLAAQIGDTVTLPCSGQGSPVPSITWFKRGPTDPYHLVQQHSPQSPSLTNVNTRLSSSLESDNSVTNRVIEVNGILTFRPVRLSDSGKYICTVNNSIGRDQIETELDVTEPLKVSLSPKVVVAIEGQEMVSFNCSISGSPIRKIFWRKDGGPLPLMARYHSSEHGLTIVHIKREDRGMYSCCVANDHNSICDWSSLTLADDPPKLIELFQESILIEPGSRLSLKCSASGSPLPQITWTLDGYPIGEQLRVRVGDYVTTEGTVNSFVNITSITIDEGGLYTCLATNGIGSTATHSGRVNVLGRPSVKPMGNVTIVAGSTFTIPCPYSGHPIETISWYRRDSRLPENHRHIVLPNGTLIIRGVERSHDQGLYRCLVTNKEGESGASSVFIQVIVAPLISIDSAPNIREGMRNMLTCNVLDGDPPFTFMWTKDGQPIDHHSQNQNLNISSINEYSSTLFISKVTFKDNGNYTCIISNLAASANATINMLVKVPPKWTLAPSDADAIVGDDVILDCQASGYPQPRIWWEHSNSLSSSSSSPLHYQPVISNSHIHALENGSLIIKEIIKSDEGYYLCQATNGIGSDISKVIKISVHVPPYFESSFTAQPIKKGDSLELPCEPHGEKPITLSWSKDRMPFDPAKESNRYKIIDSPEKETRFIQILKIESADRRDSALFTCTATNNYGKDELNIQVILQEPPDRPDNVRVTDIESRSSIVRWSIPYSGNSIILSFTLEYKKKPVSWESKEILTETILGSINSMNLRNLEPTTIYQLRMKSTNALGSSEFSDIIEFKTDEETPSLPPEDVKVFPVTSKILQVTWKPVPYHGQNGPIKGYYLGYRVHGSGDPYIFKTIASDGSINTIVGGRGGKDKTNGDHRKGFVTLDIDDDGDLMIENSENDLDERQSSSGSSPSSSSSLLFHSVKIDNLRRSTKYAVIVQAFNSKGPGPQSEEIIAETLINDPPPAPILTIGTFTYSSIELHWSFNEDSLSSTKDSSTLSSQSSDILVNGYYIHYKSHRSDWSEKQVSGLIRSIVMDNLDCGTSYQFYINAYNNLGKGDPSQVIAGKTKGSVPAPPSTELFISTNSTTANLNLASWKSWGCPISHFEIQYKVKHLYSDWILVSNQIDGDDKYSLLTDLKPATWYSLLVTAHSDAGPTDREYSFATLTDNGATISPLDSSRPLYPTLSFMVPTSCAVIVLIVIIVISLLLIFKGHSRRPMMVSYDETCGVTCGEGLGEQVTSGRDERLLSCGNIVVNGGGVGTGGGGTNGNSNGILLTDHGGGKDLGGSLMGSEFCETPSKLYYPSPYATNHVDYSTMLATDTPTPPPPPPPPPPQLNTQGLQSTGTLKSAASQQQHPHLNVHLHPSSTSSSSSSSSAVIHSIHHQHQHQLHPHHQHQHHHHHQLDSNERTSSFKGRKNIYQVARTLL